MLLSIMGMYEYDNTILDGIEVPEGLDREALIDNIIIECAELEVLYSRAETMKLAVSVWSKACRYTWQKLYDTTVVEYNPIWNVDADIVDRETIDGKRAENRTIDTSGQDKRTANLTETQSVKGFNSNSWAESEKTATTGTDTYDHTSDVADNLSGSDSTEREYTQRRTGNIGVTTTQQMIEQEREVAKFNLIHYITDEFKRRFCVLVY